MYLFYNSEGKFKWASGADFPVDNLVVEPGMSALYLDDNDINNQDIIKNYPNYTMIDNAPVYTPIPDSVKLPFERQSKIQELNTACNQEILNGFNSSVLGESHDYSFDEEWQANFNRQMNALLLDPTIESVNWVTKDSGIILHTRQQFIDLYKESNFFINEKIGRYHTLETEINNSESINDIISIQW